jgi:hydrogenase maturation protease
VLGLGNPLLRDDGVGLCLLEALAVHAAPWGGRVELVDGGTQGLALLGRIAGRRALLLLDAIALGAWPGTVHRMDAAAALQLASTPGATAHEGGAGTLLAVCDLIGDLPGAVAVLGIEPAEVATGIGLSPPVRAALPKALEWARGAVESLLAALD